MTPKERLMKYSFAVRYKGRWARVKEDQVDLPPDSVKSVGIKKSPVITKELHANQDCQKSAVVQKPMKCEPKSGASTKRKYVDDEESQPTLSQKEKTDKNSGSISDLDEPGTKVRQSHGKCARQSIRRKTHFIATHRCHMCNQLKKKPASIYGECSKSSSTSDCQLLCLTEGNDQSKASCDASEKLKPASTHEESNKNSTAMEFSRSCLTKGKDQPLKIHAPRHIRKKHKPGSAPSMETAHFGEIENMTSESDENMTSESDEDIEGEKCQLRSEYTESEEDKKDSPAQLDPTVFSDTEDATVPPEVRAFEEYLNRWFPSAIYNSKAETLSRNGASNNCSNGVSDSATNKEHATLTEYSESDPCHFKDE